MVPNPNEDERQFFHDTPRVNRPIPIVIFAAVVFEGRVRSATGYHPELLLTPSSRPGLQRNGLFIDQRHNAASLPLSLSQLHLSGYSGPFIGPSVNPLTRLTHSSLHLLPLR